MGSFFTGKQHLAILVETLSIPSTIIKLMEAAVTDFSLAFSASESIADSVTPNNYSKSGRKRGMYIESYSFQHLFGGFSANGRNGSL